LPAGPREGDPRGRGQAGRADAQGRPLLERSFAIEDKRLVLERKWKDEMLEVLPAKALVRFFQVDSRLNNLINLEVSSQIPLVN
jgi:hypothetical protein